MNPLKNQKRFLKIGLVTIVVVAFAFPDATSARDWFVNNSSGTDINDGSRNAPFLTINRAIRAANYGDRVIVVKTGIPYRECLTLATLRKSGTDTLPFRLESNGAVLEGRFNIPPDGWEHVGDNLFRYQPKGMSHQILYDNDAPMDRADFDSNRRLPPRALDIEFETWALHRGWIYFRPAEGKSPYQYKITCCGHPVGITLFDVENVSISGLVIQGFQIDGINLHDRANRVRISRCVIRGNGRSGVSIGGASDVVIEKAIIGNNGSCQFRSEGYCRAQLNQCDLLTGERYGPITRITGGTVFINDEEQPVETSEDSP